MTAANEQAPRPIRLGVIGTGLAVEQLHWPALKQMPERYRIVAFANHTRPKAEHFVSYTGASMDDYHQDYREAAELAVAVGVDTAVPVHYGMFAGNTVPPGHFVSYLAEAHPQQQVHVMGRYGFFLYHRQRMPQDPGQQLTNV